MDLYRFSVLLHIVLGILFTGLALYWIILVTALQEKFGAAESGRLLEAARGIRWPPPPLPKPLRLPLPWLTWLLILALGGTGIVNYMLGGVPKGIAWVIKMALFVAIVALQLVLTRKAHPALIRINFLVALAVIVVSGWVIR